MIFTWVINMRMADRTMVLSRKFGGKTIWKIEEKYYLQTE